MSRSPVLALIAAIAALGVAGCESSGGGGSDGARDAAVKLVWGKARGADERRVRRRMRGDGAFRELVSGVSGTLVLPREITVAWSSDEDAPYYDPERRRIVMGYPFVATAAGLFLDAGVAGSRREALDLAQAVSLFVFVHELAHALIDQLDIPATGREEDAADQLAVVVSTELIPEGDALALATAELFDLFAESRGGPPTESEFWDEHSLDEQRFRQILCLLTGANPKEYAPIIRVAGAPPGSAPACREEYDRVEDSWAALLEDHVEE